MKFRSVVMGLAALGVLTSISACKPIRSEQGAKPAQGEQSVQAARKVGSELSVSDLNIDFTSSDHESVNYLEGVIRDGNALQLKKRVVIASSSNDSKDKKGANYLVLPEVVGIRKIVDASYEYRSVSPSNETYSAEHRSLLSYDRDRHEYFLPLSDLKGESGHGLSSLDLQVLDLTLNLDDGSSSHFEVRFYVKADLPIADQIRSFHGLHEPEMVTAQGGGREKVRELSLKSGWTVMTDRYTNPTSQPLVLWFSSKGISYRLETELGAKFLDDLAGLFQPNFYPNSRPKGDGGFETDMHRYAKAPLEKVELLVISSKTNESRTVPLSKESSIPVEILPGETLLVEWRVLSEANAPNCSDGARATRMAEGCDMTRISRLVGSGVRPQGDCGRPGNQLTATKEIQGVWAVKQFRVSGEFKNEVQITEDIGTTPQALEQAQAENQAVSLSTVSTAPESWGSAAEMYSCQGIF